MQIITEREDSAFVFAPAGRVGVFRRERHDFRFGRRWQLRVLWELSHGEALRFRALQAAAGVSPSVLNARLSEATEAGIVTLTDDGYVLTDEGRALLKAFSPLAEWAERWAKRAE